MSGPLPYFTTTLKTICFMHCFMAFVGYPIKTLGSSMLPTLEVQGDRVLIASYYRRGRGLRVGDLVSVRHPSEPEEGVSKRIIGMPGDYVRIDSPSLRESEQAAGGLPPIDIKDVIGPVWGGDSSKTMIRVPEGHCWIEGDNLPWSKDSRDHGPIPLGLIKGKVIARIFPLHRAKWIENSFDDLD